VTQDQMNVCEIEAYEIGKIVHIVMLSSMGHWGTCFCVYQHLFSSIFVPS